MSRNKKSRSMKRVTGGVKTGSKERTKLENKQHKARKKAAAPNAKSSRQRSVYQQFLDNNDLVEGQHVGKKEDSASIEAAVEPIKVPVARPMLKPVTKPVVEKAPPMEQDDEASSEDLWDQLENPKNNDTF